jgi:hypothetical protein
MRATCLCLSALAVAACQTHASGSITDSRSGAAVPPIRACLTLPAGIPAALDAGSGVHPAMRLFARGNQGYRCLLMDGGAAWSGAVPEAQLLLPGPDCGPDGGLVGDHSAGPTWSWTADRSSFVGDKATAISVPSPNRAGVPWLLLHRKPGNDANAAGVLGAMKLVARLDTLGGVATQQDAGCNLAAADAGLHVEVPYRATYVFYGAD